MRHYHQLQKELAVQEEKYLRILAQKSELEYQLSVKSEEAAYFGKQESDIRALHENVRQLKHDMKNHLMVIASYLNSKDYEAAKTYTSQILDKLNTMHSYVETGNSLLNHILNEKLELARSCGIAIRAEIENISFMTFLKRKVTSVPVSLSHNRCRLSQPLASIRYRGYFML